MNTFMWRGGGGDGFFTQLKIPAQGYTGGGILAYIVNFKFGRWWKLMSIINIVGERGHSCIYCIYHLQDEGKRFLYL